MKLSKIIIGINRFIYLFILNITIKKKPVTIISNNCIGGLIYHSLKLRFDSPTINLFIKPDDYIKFLNNLDYYLSIDFSDIYIDKTFNYPIGILEDITINFVHYKTREEAVSKWNERKKRVNKNSLFVIFSENGNINNELLNSYFKLKYNKIFYTIHKNNCINEQCIYVPGFENDISIDYTMFYKLTGKRLFEKYTDIYNIIFTKHIDIINLEE